MNSSKSTSSPEEIWRRYDEMEVRLSRPLTERMLALASLKPGMRVLDLATGRGEPAIPAAHRVGPTGKVVGIDISEPMLKLARERANREGIQNLELLAGNAEKLDGIPSAHFHVTLARWGLMYMDAPVSALVAAKRAVVSGGVLVAALWAEPERVSYFTFPRQVLQKYRSIPETPPDTPGTFRFADEATIRRDFDAAGLRISLVEEMELPVMEASTDSELVQWTRAFGMNRLLQDLPEETQRKWEEDLVTQSEPFKKDGVTRLGGVTRIVVAT